MRPPIDADAVLGQLRDTRFAAQLIDLVRDRGCVSAKQIALQLNIDVNAARKILEDAVCAGVLVLHRDHTFEPRD